MPGLEDLYREIILDHYRNPRNAKELESPPALRAEGYNPLCGDEVVITLLVDEGRIQDIGIGGQGCSISRSSASLMTVSVKGKTLEEASAAIRSFKAMMSIHESSLAPAASQTETPTAAELAKMGELAALQGVVKFPVRIKCAVLAWNTLSECMAKATDAQP